MKYIYIPKHTLCDNTCGGCTLTPKTVTQTGTYRAIDDSKDGYSSVNVNIPIAEDRKF